MVRDLRPNVIGRRLTSVRRSKQALRKRWSQTWAKTLANGTIQGVERRGKWIIMVLDSGARLIIHLGMTGQLQVVKTSAPIKAHTHLIMRLDAGHHELRFRDVRRFGSATVLRDSQEAESFFQSCALGPEPFDVPAEYWRRELAHTRRTLKAILLDQRVLAGVGNIYADEALFEAGLPPWREGRKMSREQAERLRKAIEAVLNRAITQRGSSIRDYVGGNGDKGNFQNEFRVYGRTGEACQRCRTAIASMRLAGRSTHFCPVCQGKPPRSRTVARTT